MYSMYHIMKYTQITNKTPITNKTQTTTFYYIHIFIYQFIGK